MLLLQIIMSVVKNYFGNKIFPSDRCKIMSDYLGLLDYCPGGIPSEIARRVGCGRQYVSQILNSEKPFTEKSDTAISIWMELESMLRPVGDINHERLEKIRKMKT